MRWEIFIRVSIILLLVSGVILLFGNRDLFPRTYNPTFMGVMALLQVLLLVVPSYLFYSNDPVKQRHIVNLQLSLILVFFLNNIGALGLYHLYYENFQYDKIVHFLNSFFLLLAATYFFAGWFPLTHSRAMKIALAILLLGGVGWEILEIGLDWLFGTATVGLGVKGHLKTLDTILDIVFNGAGVATAVFIATMRIWNKKVENKETKLS